MSFDTPKETLRRLIELFRTNFDQYQSPNYDEANTRTDFIDKFFELLGWDVRNVSGYSEQYRDVVREDRVVIDNRPKAPDYSFRIGGYRKFFVEAKKPSVNIKDEISPAFQIRRYGYTAKLPLSILTDFEEFAVYDTRIKPHKNDKASTARIFYCKYDQYLEKCSFEGFDTNFDYIVGTFSKESVLRGSFDRYIEATKNKRGTSEVDKELLALVETWRLDLAKTIAKANPSLDSHNLNAAVQRIIDRILFLRIAEDRQIERYEDLLHATEKQNVYKNLHSLFVGADEKYNAGLFKQEEWLNRLQVDDKVLVSIIKGLYYPESPYEFSVLPIEILGSIYERFLGKTIRLTAGHQAKVEEKPEVRKAGGVYYTPQYIVDYIVRETIGRKLHGVTSAVERNLRVPPPVTILDPACGSGSFLVGAYTFLLNWHRSHYEANHKAALKKGLIYEAGENTYCLSIEEKQRILLNNIYGVDIDPIAVEVTKLSLYLKLLENETEESREMLFRHSDLKMLPNLDNNIQCGNSLIENDFYQNKELPLFGDSEMRKINAFDWQQAFPKIFKTGGFDCVIGNPPYVRIQEMKRSAPEQVEYFKTEFKATTEGNYDLYTLFLEKGLLLLNSQGRLGMICPNKFFTAQYGRPIREILATGNHLSHIVNFGHNQVFDNATTYTSLLFLDKEPSKEIQYVKVQDIDAWREEHGLSPVNRTEKKSAAKPTTTTPTGPTSESGMIPCHKITDAEWNFTVGKGALLFEKLSQLPVKLGDVAAKIFQGVVTSADSIFLLEPNGEIRKGLVPVINSTTGKTYRLETTIVKHLCKGAVDVRRYFASSSKYLVFPYDIVSSIQTKKAVLHTKKFLQDNAPNIWEYLLENKKTLRDRENGKMRHDGWYGYVYPKSITSFESPKILTPSIASVASFTFDTKGEFYFMGSGGGGGYGITLDEQYGLTYGYVTALLNSRILDWYVKQISSQFRGGYYAYNRQYIEKLPIITPTTKRELQIHDRLVTLVDQMLTAQAALHEAISNSDHKLAQQRVSILDRQIDGLVYELYGLTEEEIGVVEGG